MRPSSIVRFERVVVLSMLLGLITVALNWHAASAPFRRLGYGENFFIGAFAISIAIMLALLWLIARRGNAIAKWIYTLLYGGSILMALLYFSDNLRQPPAILILQLVQSALILYSIWLLFRPDTRGWFGRGRTAGA